MLNINMVNYLFVDTDLVMHLIGFPYIQNRLYVWNVPNELIMISPYCLSEECRPINVDISRSVYDRDVCSIFSMLQKHYFQYNPFLQAYVYLYDDVPTGNSTD